MRSIDRLEQQRRIKRHKQNLPPPEEEMEEEMDRPRALFLNRNRSVFDSGTGNGQGGINTAPSAFDRCAVFKTR